MKWLENSVLCCFFFITFHTSFIATQELNVLPNVLRPYFWNTDQHHPINFMANISEKLFHFKKIGLKFGAFNVKCEEIEINHCDSSLQNQQCSDTIMIS